MSKFTRKGTPNDTDVRLTPEPTGKAGDVHDVRWRNLIRLINKHEPSERGYQLDLARKLGIHPVFFNRVIKRKRSLSSELQQKLCELWGVRPWEFDIEDDTPIVNDTEEINILSLYRQAKRLGLERDVLAGISFLLEGALRKIRVDMQDMSGISLKSIPGAQPSIDKHRRGIARKPTPQANLRAAEPGGGRRRKG